jgi:hypothetical protein
MGKDRAGDRDRMHRNTKGFGPTHPARGARVVTLQGEGTPDASPHPSARKHGASVAGAYVQPCAVQRTPMAGRLMQ